MFAEEVRALIAERENTNDEWIDGLKRCWESETELLARDISETIGFFENDCTAEEFVWLSEVFDDVSERVHSRKFIDCLYKIAQRFPEVVREYNILYCIKIAEDMITDDTER